jgi:hypothetical protein
MNGSEASKLRMDDVLYCTGSGQYAYGELLRDQKWETGDMAVVICLPGHEFKNTKQTLPPDWVGVRRLKDLYENTYPAECFKHVTGFKKLDRYQIITDDGIGEEKCT